MFDTYAQVFLVVPPLFYGKSGLPKSPEDPKNAAASGHAPRVRHEEPKHLLLVEGQGMRQAFGQSHTEEGTAEVSW